MFTASENRYMSAGEWSGKGSDTDGLLGTGDKKKKKKGNPTLTVPSISYLPKVVLVCKLVNAQMPILFTGPVCRGS